MSQNETFGEYIRQLRESKKLPLRKVAAAIDIDQSTLSKIERGERLASKEMAHGLANLFFVEEDKLLVMLLSDKIANELIAEDNSEEILKVAEEKVKYMKSKNYAQGSLNF